MPVLLCVRPIFSFLMLTALNAYQMLKFPIIDVVAVADRRRFVEKKNLLLSFVMSCMLTAQIHTHTYIHWHTYANV